VASDCEKLNIVRFICGLNYQEPTDVPDGDGAIAENRLHDGLSTRYRYKWQLN